MPRSRCLALGFLLLSSTGFAKNRDADFIKVLDQEWNYYLAEYPEMATVYGFGKHETWTDRSLAAQSRREEHSRIYLKIIESFRESDLSPKVRGWHQIVLADVRQSVALQGYQPYLMPISQLDGFHVSVPRTLKGQPAKTVEDFQHIQARLRKVPALIEQSRLLLEQGLKKNLTHPRIILRDVSTQIRSLMPDDCQQSPLLAIFQTMPPTIDPKQQEALRGEACKTVNEIIKPSLTAFLQFWESTYYPSTRESIGATQLPDGANFYKAWIQTHLGLPLEAQAVHQTGLDEVKRLDEEIAKVMRDVKFQGDRRAFQKFLAEDEQFYFKNKDELLIHYRDLAKRIDGLLPQIIGTLPRMTYALLPVPAYIENVQPLAYYQLPSAKAGRPGQFFVNTRDLKQQPRWGMVPLTLHEAVPGHHLQLALADELGEMPAIVKYTRNTAFTEGWGLYAESLGQDLDLYQDPYVRYGQLTYNMWRAVRLVVDTGMHALGWTRDQAIDFFVDKTGKDRGEAISEIDRYIAWPGQALAYKIGEMKIQQLRAEAEKTLGPRFDIRGFHDAVLGRGNVNLVLLEAQVKEWVQSQRK